MSQPTIGQQLTLLEEELNVVLLTRSGRGVRPTAAGESMIEPLSRLVAAEDAVHEAALASSCAYQGTVRIGGVSMTVEMIVAPVVGRLRASYPGLRFSVREDASSDIEAAVLAGDLDLATITTPADDAAPGLTREHLVSSPVGIQVTPEHPLATRASVRWADLNPWPIVSMRRGTVLAKLLHDQLPSADTVVEAMSARTVQVMVAQGAGVGFLAGVGAGSRRAGLAWIPVTDAEPIVVSLVQRSDSPLSRAASIVRNVLRDRAKELGEEF